MPNFEEEELGEADDVDDAVVAVPVTEPDPEVETTNVESTIAVCVVRDIDTETVVLEEVEVVVDVAKVIPVEVFCIEYALNTPAGQVDEPHAKLPLLSQGVA